MQCQELVYCMNKCKILYEQDPNLVTASKIAMVAISYPHNIHSWIEFFKDIPEVYKELAKLHDEISNTAHTC